MANFQAFNASDLGASLRHERQARGLTQRELADKAQCRRETLSRLESGENVSLYVLMSVLSALHKGVEICDIRLELERLEELFGGDDSCGYEEIVQKNAKKRVRRSKQKNGGLNNADHQEADY